MFANREKAGQRRRKAQGFSILARTTYGTAPICRLPMTPDRVLAELKKAEAGRAVQAAAAQGPY